MVEYPERPPDTGRMCLAQFHGLVAGRQNLLGVGQLFLLGFQCRELIVVQRQFIQLLNLIGE